MHANNVKRKVNKNAVVLHRLPAAAKPIEACRHRDQVGNKGEHYAALGRQ